MFKKIYFILLACMFIGSVCFAGGTPSAATNEASAVVQKTSVAPFKKAKTEKKNKNKHSAETKKALEKKTKK